MNIHMKEKDINKMIGKTVIQTISDSPTIRRVGIILEIDRTPLMTISSETIPVAKIIWQPTSKFPVHQKPYISLHCMNDKNIFLS